MYYLEVHKCISHQRVPQCYKEGVNSEARNPFPKRIKLLLAQENAKFSLYISRQATDQTSLRQCDILLMRGVDDNAPPQKGNPEIDNKTR